MLGKRDRQAGLLRAGTQLGGKVSLLSLLQTMREEPASCQIVASLTRSLAAHASVTAPVCDSLGTIALSPDASGPMFDIAVSALTRCGTDCCLKWMLSVLNDGDLKQPDRCHAALRAAAKVRRSEAAILSAIRSRISTLPPDCWEDAVLSSGEIARHAAMTGHEGAEETLTWLRDQLENVDYSARLALIISTIGRVGLAAGVDVVRPFLWSEDTVLRAASISALGWIDSDAALALLRGILDEDNDETARGQAVSALACFLRIPLNPVT